MKKIKIEELQRVIKEVIKEEICNLMTPQPNWLRSSEVKKMLKISDSTLQTFRINGTIPAYKLDNMWFYKYDEIVDALEKNRQGGSKNVIFGQSDHPVPI